MSSLVMGMRLSDGDEGQRKSGLKKNQVPFRHPFRPCEQLPLHVMKEAEMVRDLVPHAALATLDDQRALLEGHRVHGAIGARVAAQAGESNHLGASRGRAVADKHIRPILQEPHVVVHLC